MDAYNLLIYQFYLTILYLAVKKETKMRKFLKYFHQGEKGFTLIELLVVIAILGALAGIVLLNISSFIGKGKCEGYCTEKHNVTTACISAKVTAADDTYTDFLVGAAKYDWTGKIGADCIVAPAVDAPSPACDCD
jgi:prepilin-type N-terminal cleavage/methylation domain-containing protein